MKKSSVLIVGIWFALVLSLGACDNGPLEPNEKILEFSFEQGLQGWVVGFADYPVGEEAKFELSFAHAALPEPLDLSKKALRVSGKNHSDDLFMFIKKKIGGLDANVTYFLTFNLKMASDAPVNGVGVGGSPAITLKVGATKIEPNKVAVNDFYLMNIDKGEQLADGRDMMTIGDTGNGTDEFKYVLIERTNLVEPFEVLSDGNGEVWVIIGTDSGYESTSTLYYDSIRLSFKRK